MKHTVAALALLLIPTVALGGPPAMVTDLAPGPADANIFMAQSVGTTLVFRRNSLGLWRSDATAPGTFMLLNTEATNLTSHGDHVDFTQPGVAPHDELWATDGTVPGTAFVATIPGTTLCTPFSCNSFNPNPNGFTTAGNLLFFVENTWAVWRSDQTDPGTTRIANFSGQACSIGCLCCFLLGGTLAPIRPVNQIAYYTGVEFGGLHLPLFAASESGVTDVMPGDGIVSFLGVRGRLFMINVTGPTTLQVRDGFGTRTVEVLGDGTLAATGLTAAGGLLYLVLGENTPSGGLWRSDGTAAGTFEVLAAPISELTAVGDRLFFRLEAPGGDELWITDGTVGGTTQVVALPPSHLTEMNGLLYFVTSDATNGEELWSSDGTPGGTAPVDDIVPGPTGSAPNDLTAACGRLYFTATTAAAGRELWAFDVTPGVCDTVDQASCTSNADCDDGVPCTTDFCNAETGCTSTPNNGLCNDGNPCTSDVCTVANGCIAIPQSCCTSNADCDDEDACTEDVCNISTGACTSTPFACCGDAECDDEDPCTIDTCDGETGCSSALLSALDAVTCVLGAAGSEAAQCPGETITPRVMRQLDRVRALIDAAQTTTKPLSAINRARTASRRLTRLIPKIGREADRGKYSPACSDALVAMATLARDRIDAWLLTQ